MGLEVNLQTMQQLTILVTFFSNQKSIVRGVQAKSQSNFYYSQLTVLFLLLLLLITGQLSNLIIRYYRQSSNLLLLILLFLILLLLNVSQFIYVQRNELIIIGWAFMHELNISSALSLARIFLTQQLIYNNTKLENTMLVQIFLYQTPVQPETFIYLEEKYLAT